jgi:hypothetical protein
VIMPRRRIRPLPLALTIVAGMLRDIDSLNKKDNRRGGEDFDEVS